MAATGSVPARARRHPITVVARARELAAGHWTPTEIVELLARDGVTVDESSVRRWTNAHARRQAERQEQQRRARASGEKGARPMGPHHATPEFKLARMRALRGQAGLKDTQIARLMLHDFGDEMSAYQVGRALAAGSYPQSAR